MDYTDAIRTLALFLGMSAAVTDPRPPSESLVVDARLVDAGAKVSQCAPGGHFTIGTVMHWEIVDFHDGHLPDTDVYAIIMCPSGMIGDSRAPKFSAHVGDVVRLKLHRGDSLSQSLIDDAVDKFKANKSPRFVGTVL